MAHHRICPRCTSWRVEGTEAGSCRNRLLQMVNLRLYRCRDCGWQRIAKAKEQETLAKALRRSSTWKSVLFCFAALLGIYAAANLLLTFGGKSASPARSGSPVTAAPTKNAAGAVPLQGFKVIGNSDSKRYHLPGMKYYQQVDAYHRVEFSSEDEAIKAGYHKAPR
ncbi:MAG: hypothetical protein M0009_02730 [Deltaproteobacteria bacterium]|nr:hypothetical protein [Deltaproteobacteria bacterium]